MSKILKAGIVLILSSILSLGFSQELKQIEKSEPLGEVKKLEVKISFGQGRIELSPGNAEKAYEAELEYSRRYFSHELDYHIRGDTGVLDLRVKGRRKGLFYSRRKKNWLNLKLNPTVPIDLDLNMGACESSIDLSGLRISMLELSTGASEVDIYFDEFNKEPLSKMEVNAGVGELKVSNLGNANCQRLIFKGGIGEYELDFSGQWQDDCQAEVKIGIGEISLKLPRYLGVKLIASKSFLSTLDLDGFVKEGDVYYSQDYNQAEYHLTLRVKAGIGEVNVSWIH